MFFILFLVGVDSQFLTNFSTYNIDFQPGHKEYLSFQGENATIYLCEDNGWYNLFVVDGENHEIYTSKIQPTLRFSYDGIFRINEEPMIMMVSHGKVNLDIEFKEIFLAPIKAISATNSKKEIDQLQVCYDFSTERLSLKIVLGLVCFVAVISNHGIIKTAIETLLQSSVLRRLSWRRSFLSGDESKVSRSEKETSV